MVIVSTYELAPTLDYTDYYDAAGNLLNDGSQTYTYDALNRVLSVGTTTNTYNGDSTLVAQTQNSLTTHYVHDLAAPLSQILSDGTQRYVYGTPAERLSAQHNTTRTWYRVDTVYGHCWTMPSRVWGRGFGVWESNDLRYIAAHPKPQSPDPKPEEVATGAVVRGGNRRMQDETLLFRFALRTLCGLA